MESLTSFFDRRRIADERSRANLEWEIKKTRMATTPEGFVAAAGLQDSSTYTEPEWVPLDAIQFFDAGPRGNIRPDPGRTALSDRFSCLASTYIGYLVDMPNPAFRQSDLRFRVFARYVHLPRQDALDVPTYSLTVPASHERLRFYHSVGFAEPGHWMAGNYMVEVLADRQYYFRGHFEMV